MPLPNRIFSIIVPAGSAVFSAHTYSQVYAGGAGSATINGTAVTLAAGSKLDLVVGSIASVTGDIYLLGDKKDTFTGSQILG
jgi:hypothetical protein